MYQQRSSLFCVVHSSILASRKVPVPSRRCLLRCAKSFVVAVINRPQQSHSFLLSSRASSSTLLPTLIGTIASQLIRSILISSWVLSCSCRYCNDASARPFQKPHARLHSLGYVNGICGLGPSPIRYLIGGTTTAKTGPMQPRMTDQKIAGFWFTAHLMYCLGDWKMLTGAIAAGDVVRGVQEW